MRRARVSSGVGLLAALGVVVAAAVTVRAADDHDKVAPGRLRRPGGAEGVRAARGVVARSRAGRAGTVPRVLERVGRLGLEAHQRLGRTGDNGQDGQVSQGGRASAGQGARSVRLRGDPRRRHVPNLRRGGGGGQEAPGSDRRRQGPGRRSAPGFDQTRCTTPACSSYWRPKTPSVTPSRGSARSATRARGSPSPEDESYPLCVVTEGRGTIQVSYKGKTYWVCCTGCRDLFKDHPERVLAEAAAREKAAAKK